MCSKNAVGWNYNLLTDIKGCCMNTDLLVLMYFIPIDALIVVLILGVFYQFFKN